MEDQKHWNQWLQGGKHQALFKELVQAASEKLYWHARAIVLRHDWADDVLQESFVRIWKALPKFRAESSFYTWMYRIVTREALALLKKEQRYGKLEDGQLPGAWNDPFFDGDQAIATLERAIHELPEKQQLVFKLRYFQEMPYEEMSDLLNTSTGALKASFHHAKEKITQKIKKL